MQISQLEYLLAVEDAGSINRAASNLLVSQSLVSSAIKKLEEELGSPLLTRGSKGVQLTSFGREFLPYARSVLTQIDQMKLLGTTNGVPSYNFTICNNNYRFTVDLMADLYNKHRNENIEYAIKDCSRQEAIELLSNHMAEIAVMRIWSFQSATMGKQLKSKNVLFFPLVIAPLSVVVGPKSPFYRSTETTIPSEALVGYPIITYDYARYNPNVNVQDMIPTLKNNKVLSVSSRNAATELLYKTDAICLTASYSEQKANAIKDYEDCRILELKDCSITAQIGYMKHKERSLSPIAQEFIDMLSDYLQNR